MLTWEAKHHNSKCPRFPSSSPALHAGDMIPCGMECLVQLESDIPAVSLPSFLSNQAPHWWGGVRSREVLTLCKNCSAVMKNSLFY